MKIIRDFQQEAIDSVFDALHKGINRQLIVFATGLGKTFTTTCIMKQFKKTLWITHVEELIIQSAKAIIAENPDASVGIIKQERFDIEADVVVASIQTLHRRLDKIDSDTFDCIVIDECFPAGTLVDGKPIESLKEGDLVRSYNHNTNKIELKPIVRLFKKKANTNLVKIILSDGTNFICTDNHPIYTKELGYVPAISLSLCNSQVLHTLKSHKNEDKNVFNLQKRISASSSQHENNSLLFSNLCQERNLSKKINNSSDKLYYLQFRNDTFWKERIGSVLQKFPLLLRFLSDSKYSEQSAKSSSNQKERFRFSQKNFGKNEEIQSNVQFRNESKNERIDEGQNLSFKRGKRTVDQTSNVDAYCNESSYGISNRNSRSQTSISISSELLQGRLSGTVSQISNRNRWQDSQVEEMEISGQEKNGNFEFVRVASVEIYKRSSGIEFEQMCPEGYVYNIEVEKNHNYFVENTLVHNCHLAMAPTWLKAINHFSPKLTLGLTATPERLDGISLGNLFDEIVIEKGIDFGIRNGYLVELDGIRVSTTVNLDKVRTTAGELNLGDLSRTINTPERNRQIVSKWKEYCPDTTTLAFCVDMQHAMDLSEAFIKAGISSRFVVSDEKLCPDRKDVIAGFKRGDFKVLTNVMILTAGFDHPPVETIITARPTKSKTVFLQQVGRGTRPVVNVSLDTVEERLELIKSSSKPKCSILDIVDATNRHELVNSYTLDKTKPLEERVFMTSETKQIIAFKVARQRKLEEERKEDEKVKLISLPKIVISNSPAMREPATDKQLKWLKDLGYDIVNNAYTKRDCSELISNSSAYKWQIDQLERNGYDVSKGVKLAQATMVLKEMLEKKIKSAKPELKINIPFKGLK